MIIKKTFKLEIYDHSVTLFISDTADEIDTYLFNKYTVSPQEFNYDGLTVELSHAHFGIVLIKQTISHNVIGHENYHLTEFIGESVGIYDEEAKAWIMGYVSQKIYELLKQLNIKVTH